MSLFRNLLLWLALAAVGVLLAHMLVSQDHGFLLVRYAGHNVSTTLLRAVGAVVLGLLLLWLLWKLVSLPFRTWHRRRVQRSRTLLGDGLEALHQGHLERARKLLEEAAEDPAYEMPARLALIRLAQTQGDAAAARGYLDGFGDRHASSRAIAEARMALAADRPTDALVALDVPAAQPLPPRGLALRARALAASGQALQAYELLGPLRRQHALPEARLSAYERDWAAASLREAGDGNALANRWEALPKALRLEPAVAGAYVDRAAGLGWEDAATRTLGLALEAGWDESLAARYGNRALGAVEARASAVESWLARHPESAALRLAAARLAQEQGDPAGAEHHLHQAIAHGAGAPAWELLGDSLLARGDEAGARQCYHAALRTSRGETVTAPETHGAGESAAGDGGTIEERDKHGLPRLRGDAGEPPPG